MANSFKYNRNMLLEIFNRRYELPCVNNNMAIAICEVLNSNRF